jgi:hypothetical protein
VETMVATTTLDDGDRRHAAPHDHRRPSTLSFAHRLDGLISKASFDTYMDKHLKETFGVSSDKELAEMKRQHRATHQGQKGKISSAGKH